MAMIKIDETAIHMDDQQVFLLELVLRNGLREQPVFTFRIRRDEGGLHSQLVTRSTSVIAQYDSDTVGPLEGDWLGILEAYMNSITDNGMFEFLRVDRID